MYITFNLITKKSASSSFDSSGNNYSWHIFSWHPRLWCSHVDNGKVIRVWVWQCYAWCLQSVHH